MIYIFDLFPGKFGQRTEFHQGKFVTDPDKFIKMCNDPAKNLMDFRIISDDVLHVKWETTPGYERETLVTSEIHASLVTSYAR